MIDPDIPINDGFYQVIEVITTPGSVLDSRRPAAISGGADAVGRLCETALRAFATILPERAAADSKGTMLNISFGGVNPRTGELFRVLRDAGGRLRRPPRVWTAWTAIQPHLQNTENAPIEETEANYPVRFLCYALIPDSEGSGRWRGGVGLRRDYVFEGDVTFSIMSERVRFAPQGLFGGDAARSNHYIRDPDGAAIRYPSKFSIEVAAGEVMSIQRPAGVATATSACAIPRSSVPTSRPAVVTPARALDVYGVRIEPAAADG